MPSVYDSENFSGRVSFACAHIARRGGDTRHFDTCFEMYDGTAVAIGVYRRSLKNPKIAANIWKYLGRDIVMAEVEEFKHVTNLAQFARELRQKSQSDFAKLERALADIDEMRAELGIR